MGQVNVNTDRDPDYREPAGSSGAGFILGIIVAIIVIAALVYFLVLGGPDGGGDNGADNGDNGGDNGGEVLPSTDDGGGTESVAPSGWVLVERA